jgi:23S rRNA (guanosine2251-2'-O)-methyltransferase
VKIISHNVVYVKKRSSDLKKEYSRFEDSTVFEGMVSLRTLISVMTDRSAYNNRKIIKVLYSSDRAEKEGKELSWIRHRAEELGFDIELTPREEIDAIAVGNTHGGIIAFCTDRALAEPEADKIKDDGYYVMLDGIEDPYNFGYALRSLYAAGADGIILGRRNWMSAAGVVCRASAGASELMEIYVSESPENTVRDMKTKGYEIVCADLENSVSLYECTLKKPLITVIGGEKRGISGAVLSQADKIVRIDYGRSFGASLSAASAATVVGFEVLRQSLSDK